MQVLGRDIGARIDPWFDKIAGQVASANRTLEIRPGHKGSFGGTGEEETGKLVIVLADELPDAALEHTLAHELAHVQQHLEGYPSTIRPPDFVNDEGARVIGSWLHELSLGPDAEERIAHLALDTSWEDTVREKNIRRKINLAANNEGCTPGSFQFTESVRSPTLGLNWFWIASGGFDSGASSRSNCPKYRG